MDAITIYKDNILYYTQTIFFITKTNLLHYTQTERQTWQLSINKPTSQASLFSTLQIASECLNLSNQRVDLMNILLVLLSGSQNKHSAEFILLMLLFLIRPFCLLHCNYFILDIWLDDSFVSLSHFPYWEAKQRDKRHPTPTLVRAKNDLPLQPNAGTILIAKPETIAVDDIVASWIWSQQRQGFGAMTCTKNPLPSPSNTKVAAVVSCCNPFGQNHAMPSSIDDLCQWWYWWSKMVDLKTL